MKFENEFKVVDEKMTCPSCGVRGGFTITSENVMEQALQKKGFCPKCNQWVIIPYLLVYDDGFDLEKSNLI